MEHKKIKYEKICGSTNDLAELIVDYRKKGKDKAQIKGVPEETRYNIFKAAFHDWITFLFVPFIIFVGLLMVIRTSLKLDNWLFDNMMLIIVFIYFITVSILSYIHIINPKFDKKWRKFFVMNTIKGDRNKATFSQFKSKEMVIYDFSNIVVEFEATGDVSKQLYKIWIKKEPSSSILENQAIVQKIVLIDKKEDIWNAYFFFTNIPKDGELHLEWT